MASSFASAFIAKDTSVSSEGNLLNRRNGKTISTSASEFHYDLFGTDDEEELDTTSGKNTTDINNNRLGCIGGHQIEALATGSLSQPVILTDSKGGVHKVDGHDIKFSDDGGVVIAEASGRIIQIKKDSACAASAKRRRLQFPGVHYETVAWGVHADHCDMHHTVVHEDMYNSGETTQDGYSGGSDGDVEVVCYGQWGQFMNFL